MDIWVKWAEHYKAIGIEPERICKDGIFNEVKYHGAPKRILFVLRETNDYKGDLRVLFQSGPKWQMWYTVGRWTAGILKDFPPYNEVDNFEIIRESFFQIAAINLKKATGGSTADLVVINAFAYQDRELLLEQIKEISPEIIVACGTFDALMWILDIDINPDKPHDAAVRDRVTGALVIPFCHPVRVNNRETYAELKKLVAEAK